MSLIIHRGPLCTMPSIGELSSVQSAAVSWDVKSILCCEFISWTAAPLSKCCQLGRPAVAIADHVRINFLKPLPLIMYTM